MANVVVVEREPYVTKDGKSFFSYFVKGVIRGREVKAYVKPQDNGWYQVLEIVFNGEDKANLKITPFEMKDETGNIINGNTYEVESTDENGEVYTCKVKPDKQSDKMLLKMLGR